MQLKQVNSKLSCEIPQNNCFSLSVRLSLVILQPFQLEIYNYYIPIAISSNTARNAVSLQTLTKSFITTNTLDKLPIFEYKR